ncbi:MAG: D-alanyl-D-alanine carboxypeptidase/D-alanyl-D-alanine-endopeptidase, partial [Bacteroidota bacterium]
MNAQNVATVENLAKAIAQAPEMANAGFGFSLRSVENNQLLVNLNGDQNLTPASTLKTLTTASALILLGPEYTYETKLATNGKILDDGTLDGDLYIIGSGDPSLGSDQLEETPDLNVLLNTWVSEIKKLGITSIKGQIVGDGTCFDSSTTPATWPWNDIGNYYGAGVSGLNIMENLYYLDFDLSSTMKSGPKVAAVRPEIPYLIFHNELTTAGKNSGDNAYIYGAPYTYTRHIRGTLPLGPGEFTIKGSLPDPAFVLAHWLTEALTQNGVLVKGGITTKLEMETFQFPQAEALNVFYRHTSPPLKNIVLRANKESVNIYCEALLKTIGKEQGTGGSLEGGLQAIQDLWESRGLDWEGILLHDGSGLSPRNAITGNDLTAILRKVALDESAFPDFYASLPIAGQDGTLKNMLRGTPAEGKLRAKSGSMSRVRAYCGYSRTKSGKLLTFSIIGNDFTGRSSLLRQRMERVMSAISQLP